MRARQSDPLLEAFHRDWKPEPGALLTDAELEQLFTQASEPDPQEGMRAAALIGVTCIGAALLIAGVAIAWWAL